jgi:hypothetical protein
VSGIVIRDNDTHTNESSGGAGVAVDIAVADAVRIIAIVAIAVAGNQRPTVGSKTRSAVRTQSLLGARQIGKERQERDLNPSRFARSARFTP